MSSGMVGSFGIPLSWANLTHNKLRLFGALMGISFAVQLMFVQMGFYNAIFDAQNELLLKLKGDLFIASKSKFSLVGPAPFPRRRILQARGVSGVASVHPLYIEYGGIWKDHKGSKNIRPIRIIALDPENPVLDIPAVHEHAAELKSTERLSLLVDKKSKESFGRREVGGVVELCSREANIVGTFELGTDFRAEGTAIIGDKHFAKLFPPANADSSRSRVELGLVNLLPGADHRAVRAALEAALPDDVVVRSKDDLCDAESVYWKAISPIATVFTMGIVVGFLVGIMICYQTLYTEVVDYLDQFATLKAIGYADRSVVSVVMEEAVFYSILGYIAGLAQSIIVYQIVASLTGLPMRLNFVRLAMIFGLTVAMCVTAGLIAVRKVAKADPADVF